MSCPRRPSATNAGRVLLRIRDRADGSLRRRTRRRRPLVGRRSAAWDAYSVGRLGRLGYAVNEPRWRYNFRNRHGFTDAADRVFDELWAADQLTWAELSALSQQLGHQMNPKEPRASMTEIRPGAPPTSTVVELDVLEVRAGRRPRRDPRRTASPRARGRGATSCRPSPTPAGTSSRRTSAATGAPRARATVEAYGIDHLSADLLGLLDETGQEQAVFVGHDWGALIVWDLVALAPRTGARRRRRQRAVHRRGPVPPTERVPEIVTATASSTSCTSNRSGRPRASWAPTRGETMRRMLWRRLGGGRRPSPPPNLPAEGTGFLDVMRRLARRAARRG